MSVLDRINLRKNLLILPIISLLVPVMLGGEIISDKHKTALNMEALSRQTHLALRIGALVHELQRERGMSLLYLGGEGQISADELLWQRRQADLRAEALREDLQREMGQDPPPLIDVPALLEQVEQRLAIRVRVDAMHPSGQFPAEPFSAYSTLIAQLLGRVEQLPRLAADGQSAAMTSAYLHFLLYKERTGQERARVANVLATGAFDAEGYRRLVQVVAEADDHAALFLAHATPPQIDFYRKRLENPVTKKLLAIREELLTHPEQPRLEASAGQWFQMSSQKIDLLRDVEERLADDLLHHTAVRKGKAVESFWLHAVLIPLFVVGVLFL